MRALRRRQIAAFRLREFIQAATDAFAQQNDAPAPCPRPDYLWLVEPDGERMDAQEGVDS